VKTKRNISQNPGFLDCLKNEDPKFEDYSIFDYHPDTLSPVIGIGKMDFAAEFPNDLDGVDRSTPDLGAYQFVPITR
jgi:hypothetical protein